MKRKVSTRKSLMRLLVFLLIVGAASVTPVNAHASWWSKFNDVMHTIMIGWKP